MALCDNEKAPGKTMPRLLKGSVLKNMEGLATMAIFYTVLHFAAILAVTWSCSALTSASRRSADLVHKALLPPSSKTPKDSELRRQLQLFSQQLLHRHPRITACGLFVIDLSNISSMLAAVVSYLVVIVQLSVTQNSFAESGNQTAST
ncbi:putative gustatory receptor 28b [Schistocerca cancellata]|uniref:putative gustatory receptor 28b n=1 Tax=Schistocerca cancellata TaxID=274614 RepID=UPI00211997CC|nr:putative gustatory receptor 28b [Schistocerca cancellata]